MECQYCLRFTDKLYNNQLCYDCILPCDTCCPNCSSQTNNSGLCDECLALNYSCLYCNKENLGTQRYCSNECSRANAERQAKQNGANFINWISKDFQLPGQIQHEFENAFTEWLQISFWFPITEICQLTNTAPGTIYQAFIRNDIKINQDNLPDCVRFANSDTWTLRDPELAKILHSYLKIKFNDLWIQLNR